MPCPLRAYSSHPFGDLLGGLTGEDADGSAMQPRVRLEKGSNTMVMVLASVTDNATNAKYIVMGSMMNGGIGMMP